MSDLSAEREAAAAIERLAQAFERELSPPERAALSAYVEQVTKWNRKVNLTAAREPLALVEVLLADAFVLADDSTVPAAARVLDVGSGAGAPIVPLLLLRPDLSALCVEPHGKRAAFLRTLSARLALLPRMRVLEARVDEQRSPELGSEFDVASSRATFEPERWLGLGLSLAPRVLVLLANAPAPQPPAGARLELERAYVLPFSLAQRRVAVYLRE